MNTYPQSYYVGDIFTCGCCGRVGLPSVKAPICTGCANKLLNDRGEDSPKTRDYIKAYCDYWNSEWDDNDDDELSEA